MKIKIKVGGQQEGDGGEQKVPNVDVTKMNNPTNCWAPRVQIR